MLRNYEHFIPFSSLNDGSASLLEVAMPPGNNLQHLELNKILI